MIRMNNADEVWVCLGTHRWICLLVNHNKASKYAFKYYVLTASSLKRIFRCLKPTDLSKVYLDDEGITLKWKMNYIKINPGIIINIEAGVLIRIYYNNIHVKLEISYSNPVNNSIILLDREAEELWNHLCNLSVKLPGAMNE